MEFAMLDSLKRASRMLASRGSLEELSEVDLGRVEEVLPALNAGRFGQLRQAVEEEIEVRWLGPVEEV